MNLLDWAALAAGGLAILRHACALPRLFVYLLRARIRSIPRGETPPISLLKPLFGDEPGLAENLEATLRQNYPIFEVLFLHERPDDPALEAAHAAAAKVPDVPVRFLPGRDPDATNPKAAVLIRGELAAHHAILVASDSDVRPDPLYLRDAANALQGGDVAVFPPVLFGMRTVGARLMGLLVNTEGLLSVLLAGGKITPGGTMAVRVPALRAAGGWRAVSDFMADDLALGRALRACGHRAALTRRAVRCRAPDSTLPAAARHLTRWMRTVRTTAPLLYFPALLPASAPLLLLAAGLFGAHPGLALAALAFHTFARVAVAIAVDFRFCWDRSLLRALPLLPLLWFVEPLAWAAGALPGSVEWRGRRYRLRGGRATLADR